ncbi:hypothetical protein ES703_89517 [subsurface metagenome]
MVNKKLLVTLLVGVMAITLVNAALVYYLSNTIRAEVTIENSIECSFAESGTSYLNLGEIQKTGEPIVISYTQVSNNKGNSAIYTFPVTIMRGPEQWEGNEFDRILSCSSFYLDGSETIDINGEAIFCRIVTDDMLCYVDDYGLLHRFSEIGEDDNIYSIAKLFIDYDGYCIPQKYPLAPGTTNEHMIITFNPNIASGYYSMQYCHLNEIAEECDYHYIYAS